MKYLNTFNDILLERRNLGTLYHYTGLINLYYIINNNELISNHYLDDKLKNTYDIVQDDGRKYTFSFTRDKNFNKNSINLLDNYTTSGFSVDGTKLSDNHIIRPYHFWNRGNKHRTHEAEQVLISNNKIIKGIHKYITRIYLPMVNDFEEEVKFYIRDYLDNFKVLKKLFNELGYIEFDEKHNNYTQPMLLELYNFLINKITIAIKIPTQIIDK